jgi:hypothetical protein
MQHHGALVSGFLSKMNVSDTDDCVKIELVPAYLDFTNVDDSAFLTEAAGLLVEAWLPAYKGEEPGLVRNLVEKRLSINLGEFVSLGQVSSGKIGFDCIAVTIDLRMRKPRPLSNHTS